MAGLPGDSTELGGNDIPAEVTMWLRGFWLTEFNEGERHANTQVQQCPEMDVLTEQRGQWRVIGSKGGCQKGRQS